MRPEREKVAGVVVGRELEAGRMLERGNVCSSASSAVGNNVRCGIVRMRASTGLVQVYRGKSGPAAGNARRPACGWRTRRASPAKS